MMAVTEVSKGKEAQNRIEAAALVRRERAELSVAA